MKNKNKGFTLIELLITIAIIGILAGVVLVNSGSGVSKAKRASALTTAASMLPELVTCIDDSGNIAAPTNNSTGGGQVCSAAGHTVTWPNISTTGWVWNATAQSPGTNAYEYTLTFGSPVVDTITCRISDSTCT